MPFVRLAQRIYERSAIERRFCEFDPDWERKFPAEALAEGRRLYTRGAVKILELHADYAMASLKLDDGSEPYCVIDFKDSDFSVRGSLSDDEKNAAFAVAGLYEMEELIADEISPLKYVPPAKKSEPEPAQNGDSKRAEPQAESGKPARRLLLAFKIKRDVLSFSAHWREGGRLAPAFGKNSVSSLTLAEGERESLIRAASFARKAGFVYNGKCYECSSPAKFPQFCSRTINEWRRYFDIQKSADIDLVARGASDLRINVDLDCGEGSPYLSADFHAEGGGKTINFEELKFLRGAPAAGRLIPGKGFFKIADSDAENFSRAQRTLEFFGGKIPRYMMFTLFDEFSRRAVSKSAEAWRRGVLSGSLTPKLADFLRPYQKDAVSRMSALFSAGCGMLLADEMGLGKTVQTLSFIDNFWDGESRFLIVCPASVIPVWRGEAAKFFPKIKCAELAQPSDLQGSKGVLWISSYTQLRRNKQKLDGVSFHTAVLDEAQYIKNPDSKASAACMSIKAGFRLALTGTPIENRLLDMWSIFRWLMPGLLGSRADFEKRLNADRDFPQTLKRQLAPFVLRRVKREVLAELPSKNYVDLLCPMSAMQAQEYEKLLRRAREAVKTGAAADAKGRVGVLSLITRLRQASCDPALLPWIGSDCPAGNSGKISALSDALSGIIESGSKAVVFSQFTKFLDRIKCEVGARFKNVEIFELNGATKDRSAPVDGFQNAAGAAVIFVSLRAGGTGITLTGADYVFLADPWWNPAVEEQAIDRVHRIGKKCDVFIYRLISDSTVEASVRRLQERKKTLFADILGGINSGRSFEEDISEILEL